jgi:hypothetical protein
VIDEFFTGYLTGLRDPSIRLPVPRVVQRLRAKTGRTRAGFLSWAESLMQPMSTAVPAPESAGRLLDTTEVEAVAALELLHRLVAETRPALPSHYFRFKRMGALRMGIGSGLVQKILVRVEGPTTGDDDDVILEAKELRSIRGVECLVMPSGDEVARVITGARQVGRIRHDVLAVVPKFEAHHPEVWVRSWDRTYGEVGLNDLASVAELEEISRDAGVQLGAASLRGFDAEARRRTEALSVITRLEPRIRATALAMTEDMLEAWGRYANTGR